jgi:DNA-binding transcriptional regulator LsrR (DeoR family)
MARTRETKLARMLQTKLDHISLHPVQIQVFSSGDELGGIDREQLPTFARNAAGYLRALLTEDGVEHIGVGWGATVAMAIEKLSSESPPKRFENEEAILFVPTCGEREPHDDPLSAVNPGHLRPDRMSSSALAEALDRIFNADPRHHLSLRGIPFSIGGENVSDEKVQTAWDLVIRPLSDWRVIFETADPVIGRMDAILTSIAPPLQSARGYVQDFSERTGVRMELLADRVLGDIGGAWIPRRDCDHDVVRWNKWWTGISSSQYAACAKRAASQCKPGVIVLAIGANKSEVILEAVKRGFVNTLIIDHVLAAALIRVMDEREEFIRRQNVRRIQLLREAQHRALTPAEMRDLELAANAVTHHTDEKYPVDFSWLEQAEAEVRALKVERSALESRQPDTESKSI